VKHDLLMRVCSETTAVTSGRGDNPHNIRECGYQVHFRINIQAGVVRNVIVGPLLCCVWTKHIQECGLDMGARYLGFLVSRSNSNGICHVGTPEVPCLHSPC